MVGPSRSGESSPEPACWPRVLTGGHHPGVDAEGTIIDEHLAVDLSGMGPALTDNPNASRGRPRAPTALALLEKEPWLSRDLWRRSGPYLPRGSPLEQR